MNKDIKYLVERLFDDESDLLDSAESTLDELNINNNLHPDYVDLGLSSGTLWCKHNVGAKRPEEYGNRQNWRYTYITYKDLPTKEQLWELYIECHWSFTTINDVNGYKVTGPNGNSIFLPCAGYRNLVEGTMGNINKAGYYWSSNKNPEDKNPIYMFFVNSQNGINPASHFSSEDEEYSIRLCKNNN